MSLLTERRAYARAALPAGVRISRPCAACGWPLYRLGGEWASVPPSSSLTCDAPGAGAHRP